MLELGITLIQWLEGIRTAALDRFFLSVTDLGSTTAYMVLVPLVWWAVSWRLAARVFFVLVLSVYFNSLLKEAFELPRPFESASTSPLRRPGEFSFPSGHAQSAAVFWTLLALHFRSRAVAAAAVAVILLVGFSRVYLGVHYPTDVLAGWAVGLVLVAAFVRTSRLLAERVEELPLAAQSSLALAVPAALAFLHPTENTATALGALAGAMAGLAFARHRGLYPRGAQKRDRARWLAVGLAGLPAMFFALRALEPDEASRLFYLYDWVGFAAIGLWVSFLVPLLGAMAARWRRERAE